jgi:membrane protease YdiL (CAAX protease family)
MKNIQRIILGIVLGAVVFGIAQLASSISLFQIHPWLADSFTTHTTMLIVSLILIYLFTKRKLSDYAFKTVKIKQLLKPILVTVIAIILINILATLLLSLLGFDIRDTGNVPTAGMNALQIIIFIFIYASIAEEFLFRGLVQNFLKPLSEYGFKLFRIRISVPVIISAVLFGLGHLILLKTGASSPFVLRIVIYTTTIGFIAGYYQEKNNSIIPAVIVHMTANIPAVLASLFIG